MMKRALLIVFTLIATTFAQVAPAYAFNPFGGACNTQRASNSVACSTGSSDPLGGSDGLFMKVTNILVFLGGAIAVIMIIVGAIRFITAGSDVSTGSRTDTDIEDARRSIVSALIGLVVIILAKVIITFFVSKL